MPNNRFEQVTFVAGVFMAIAVFLPIATLPVVGDVTYYRVANMEAILVLLFGLAAPALLFMGKKPLTFIAPLGVWLVLLFPAIKGMFEGGDDGGMMGKLAKKASDPLADFAAELFMRIDSFGIGGYVFLIALIALTIGGIKVTLDARSA